ncbi:MAG: glutamine amidotransferase [Actinobacteria bacterium]|nr:glutamine amidotransferase [Actinomycetota bacterium]
MNITICHLYPDLMNIYGDRGNIISLTRRAEWAGLEVEMKRVDLRERPDFRDFDILFVGGGQDKEQSLIAQDLAEVKAASLIAAVEDGLALLAVCGGYQLLGKYFKTGSGTILQGIGVFDAWTVAGDKRCIGDVIVQSDIDGRSRTLVGFENHSGKTYLGEKVRPLGKVLFGFGNNGEDGYEGVAYRNAFGTYLHGSILPKNPWFTDLLIRRAVERRHGRTDFLQPVDDSVENQAHQAIIARIHKRGKMDTGAI